MDIDIPEIDFDYDYALDILMKGQLKQHAKGMFRH